MQVVVDELDIGIKVQRKVITYDIRQVCPQLWYIFLAESVPEFTKDKVLKVDNVLWAPYSYKVQMVGRGIPLVSFIGFPAIMYKKIDEACSNAGRLANYCGMSIDGEGDFGSGQKAKNLAQALYHYRKASLTANLANLSQSLHLSVTKGTNSGSNVLIAKTYKQLDTVPGAEIEPPNPDIGGYQVSFIDDTFRADYDDIPLGATPTYNQLINLLWGKKIEIQGAFGVTVGKTYKMPEPYDNLGSALCVKYTYDSKQGLMFGHGIFSKLK